MRFLTILLVFPFCISGQFFDAKSKVVYGFNFGTYIANNNSAVIYDGYKYANTSISNIIFNNNSSMSSPNKYLNDEFGIDNWEIRDGDIPIEMKHRPGVEFGLHVGIQNENIKYYLDYNFVNYKAIGLFRIDQKSSGSNSVNPESIEVGVTGEESRNFINLGFITNVVDEKEYHLGIPLFFQINQSKFKSNFISLNNQKYNIPVFSNSLSNTQNTSPSGMGIGGGSGIVFTIKVINDINLSLGYHLQYSKIKMRFQNKEDFNEWGVQHSIFARLIWTKSEIETN